MHDVVPMHLRRPMTDKGWMFGDVIIGNQSCQANAVWEPIDAIWLNNPIEDGGEPEPGIIPTWWYRAEPVHGERQAAKIARSASHAIRDRFPVELREALDEALRSVALDAYTTASSEAFGAVDPFERYLIKHFYVHGVPAEPLKELEGWSPPPLPLHDGARAD